MNAVTKKFTAAGTVIEPVIDMSPDAIRALRESYNALDLKALQQVEISDADLALILRARQNPEDDEFCKSLPLIVAEFRAAATEQFMALAAIAQVPLPPEERKTINATMQECEGDYFNDLRRINELFFDGYYNSTTPNTEPSWVTEPRSPNLHIDSRLHNHMVYLARLGNFPFEFVRGSNILADDTEIIGLIHKGTDVFGDVFGRDARADLRRREILEAFALGKVALIAGGPKGTWHCSSPVDEPGFSYFFQLKCEHAATAAQNLTSPTDPRKSLHNGQTHFSFLSGLARAVRSVMLH